MCLISEIISVLYLCWLTRRTDAMSSSIAFVSSQCLGSFDWLLDVKESHPSPKQSQHIGLFTSVSYTLPWSLRYFTWTSSNTDGISSCRITNVSTYWCTAALLQSSDITQYISYKCDIFNYIFQSFCSHKQFIVHFKCFTWCEFK